MPNRSETVFAVSGRIFTGCSSKGTSVRALNHLFSGSLLSSERLMQAREFYSPTKTSLPSEQAFARWTQRIALQTELGGARELAGLSDEELAALEAEFVRCPVRPRSDRMRQALPIGALLAFVGGVALGVQGLVAQLGGGTSTAMQFLGVACLVTGLCAVALGVLAASKLLSLDVSHGTTGLYAGSLDEQHPWLYKTMILARNAAAEEYRQGVLQKRGTLRGVDCVVMQEIVRAHDALDQTRSARSVAEQMQQPGPSVDSAAPGKPEPRLVRLAAQ